MKNLILLVALLGVVLAQRQRARDVISKFKEIAPKYLDLMEQGETELEKVRAEATDIVAKFHNDVIDVKSTYVVDAIERESGMHYQISNQPENVDDLCLGFLNTTLDMSMNLAGVGFTNCINNVDDAFNGLVVKYFASLGVQESLLQELRLLDVFRGDNVFYTPQNIIDKLDKKMSDLKINPESLVTDLEQAKEIFKADLEGILSTYNGCMTKAQQILMNGVDLMMMQLTFSCLGEVKSKDVNGVPA